MLLVRRLTLAVVALGGCIRTELVVCGTDELCPTGWTCDLANETCVPPGGLAVAPDPIELLDVPCGTTAMRTLLLRNPGTTAVDFAARTTLEALSIAPEQATIPPGGELELAVTLDAGQTSAPGTISTGEILLSIGSDTLSRTVRFSMAGALVTVSPRVDLGEIGANSVEVRPFTVANTGTTTTELDLDSLAAPFSIVTERPIRIDPGTQREVAVQFRPDGVVDQFDQLAQLSFSGVQCQPPPADLEFSARSSGDPILASNTFIEFEPAACGEPSSDVTVRLASQVPYPQQVSLTFVADPQGVTFSGGGVLPEAPGQLAIRLTRPRLDAPRAVGNFTTVLQVRATNSINSDVVTKLIPVAYAIEAPVLTANTNMLPGLASSSATVEIVNTGNADTFVSVLDTSILAANEQKVSISPKSFELAAGQLQGIELLFDAGYAPASDPNTLTVELGSKGQCNAPISVTVVPVL